MKQPILVKLGKRIQEERFNQGISQEELNSRANVSKNYVGMLERGEINVTMVTLERIAKALNISIKKLVE